MAKKKVTTEVPTQEVVEVVEVATPVVETVQETVQVRLGRPIVADSARQQRLAARAAKIAAEGVLRRGRPVVADSARQQRLAEREAKRAQGIEIKPGRPKMIKEEPVTA